MTTTVNQSEIATTQNLDFEARTLERIKSRQDYLRQQAKEYRERAKKQKIDKNLWFAEKDLVKLSKNFADDYSVINQESVFHEKSHLYDYQVRDDFIKEFVNEVLSIAMKHELVSKFRYLPISNTDN